LDLTITEARHSSGRLQEANMANRQKVRKQRQQRRAGLVRRMEVVLSAENERDHVINDYLNDLPRGAVGEFVRQAIYAAITGAVVTVPEPQPESNAAQQFNAILAELAALREAVAQPAPLPELAEVAHEQPVTDRRRRMRVSASHTQTDPLESEGGVIAGNGIDMSRPRPRSGPRAAPPPTLPEVEPPFDPEASALLLVQSIKGYGSIRDRPPH
jgi:hypothetical protein